MDLIERAVEHFETAKDLANFLGVSESQVSMLRRGDRRLQPIQAARLAKELGEEWIDHVLPLFAGQAKTEEDKAFWMGEWNGLRKAKDAGKAGFAALMVAVMVGVLAPKDAEADKSHNLMNSLDISGLCHLSDT